jgi:transcription elongation factor GreA
MSKSKTKPSENLIKAVNLYTNRMRKSRKESIKSDLSSFIQWLSGCLEPKSYNEDLDMDKINLNLIEPSFIEQYVQMTNVKHSNFNASKKLTVARDFLGFLHNPDSNDEKIKFTDTNLSNHIRNKKGRRTGSLSLKSRLHEEDVIEISQEYHDNLISDLAIRFKEREDVVVDINKAAADKDFRENAPLEAAREKQGLIESQIKTIEETLRKSAIINTKKNSKTNKIAKIGSKVTMLLNSKTRVKISLVASPEADVNTSKISVESPIGMALVGKTENEEVIVSAHVGSVNYKIVKIT